MAPPKVLSRISLEPHPLLTEIVSDETRAFLVELHERFEPARRALLERHLGARTRAANGAFDGWDPDTAHIRANEWHIAPAPRDLANRRTELTGPVTRRALVEGLNSGAQVYMADFEDTITPTWEACLDGQRNLRDAYAGTLSVDIDGERQAVGSDAATLVVRTRGWHLDESHAVIDGSPMAASLFDFGVAVFTNAGAQTSPYFYLPKFEGAADAALWNEVLRWSEERLELAPGTIRVTVLIETIGAAFAMDEILFALRDHVTGLHAGSWDYLFSLIKTFPHDPEFILPDRDDLGATTPFIRAFTELLVSTCHRRGAHAIGGMSGVIPDPITPSRTAPMERKVTVDKRREAGDGFDGTRLAQAALVEIATREFDRVLSYRANQLEVQRDDVYITASDLLTIRTTRGKRSEEGLRRDIRVAIHYLGEWLAGTGAVAIADHLEDTAMAEICRVRIWQWRHHRVELSNGCVVDNALLDRLFTEEMAALRAELSDAIWANGRFDEAASLLHEWSLRPDLLGFFTVEAADLI